MRIKLGAPLKLAEVAHAIGGTLSSSNENGYVYYLTTNTQEIKIGDLFVPLKGSRHDGEEFTENAKELGAKVVSTLYSKADVVSPKGAKVLPSLAAYYRREYLHPKHVIGITGSVGKTTTKEFLRVICKTEFVTAATEGNHNNEVGVPLTVLSAPQNTEILITELGMNALGEISELSRIVKPDIGIITKIGTSHIGMLGSRENIARAKLEILDGMEGSCLIGPEGEPLIEEKVTDTFSIVNSAANLRITEKDSAVDLLYNGKLIAKSAFSPDGTHNLECLAASALAAMKAGVSPNGLRRGISQISAYNTRQTFHKIKNLTVLDDSYNASEESVYAALKLLDEASGFDSKSAVLGTVLELGEYSDVIHERIGARAAAHSISHLFLVGDGATAMARGALAAGIPPKRIHVNSRSDALQITAREIIRSCSPNELILLKASNKLKLSEIVSELKKYTENSTC